MNLKRTKIRLYPTKSQERHLDDTLEICRGLYNSLLNSRKCEYEVNEKSLSLHDQIRAITSYKPDFPELKTVHSQVLQNVAVRIDLAFQAFFQRLKKGDAPGFPRWKGEGYDSFTYPQTGFSIQEGSITISKVGTIKAVVHREVTGKIKTCTIRRQGEKWYASFSHEVEEELLPPTGEATGIDVGIEKFAALSDGTYIDNPRFFRKEEKALAKAQRKLARQKKGSKARRKAKKIVRCVHERIANRRHNFVHQATRKLVTTFDFIAVEKLKVQNMQGNHCLAKSIADASWSMFRQVLTYKAENAGRKIVEVNPAYTSQDCSGCGHRAKKTLKERWHFCPICGLSLDRDVNAAVNILQTALGIQGVR